MKKIFALMLALMVVFVFSLNCMAAQSPTGRVLPTKEPHTQQGGGGGGDDDGKKHHDNSSTSPKTGMEHAGALVAIITASGAVILAGRKLIKK